MPSARGFATRLGAKREAVGVVPVWPGAAVAVDSLLPMLPGWTHDEAPLLDEDTTFAPGGGVGLPGVRGWRVTASGRLRLTYEGLELVWLQALGYMAGRVGGAPGGAVLPELVEAGVYRHLYEVDSQLVDTAWASGEGGLTLPAGQQKVRRATYALSEGVVANEYRSMMINRVTLSGSPMGMHVRVDLVGYDRQTAGLNTVASLGSLMFVSRPVVVFSDLIVRIGAASGSVALGVGDALSIESFELTVENGLVTDAQDSASGLRMAVPERGRAVSVSGRFRLPRFASTVHRDRLADQTGLMADLRFTGGLIPGTASPYQCHLYLPSVVVSQAPGLIADAGPLGQVVQWVAYREPSPRAGFPINEKAGPVMVELQNGNAEHGLL